MQTQENIPDLRFSEFKEIWKETILGKLGVFLGGGTPESSNKDYWNGNIPWISSSDISENNIHEISITRNITEDAVKESATKIIPKNSILIVSRVGIGKFAVANEDLCTSQDFTNLITDQNSYFLAYYFLARVNIFKRLSQGTSIKGFTGQDIKDAKFKLPQIAEQQKIATFLTAVDEKINLLQKKKKGLEQYKKGVMQQIFSQKLRFKKEDGSDFPDWEEKKLGEIGKIINGLTYSPSDINDDGILVLRSSNVKNRMIELNDNVFVNVEEEKYNQVIENDILICVRNGSKRLIGKNAIITKKYEGLAFGAFMTVYRSDFNLFLFHFFDSTYYKKEVHKNLGATINSINVSDLKNFKVPFPCKKEQSQLATFLSSIDYKIELINIQLEKTQQFKKGLLQQMFV